MMLWKVVPNFVDYEVSEFGDVRKGASPLTPERVNGSGRKRFTLSKNGQKHRFHAAKLVALAFLGPKPFDGAEVCHIDGFKHNNHFSNIRWDSKSSNTADAADFRFRVRSTGRAGAESDRLVVEASRILAG